MISNIDIGDICFVEAASPASILKYDQLKPKLPMLVCPCNIPLTQRLQVTDNLGNYVLVSYYDNPLKLSVILKKDLRKLDAETTKNNS